MDNFNIKKWMFENKVTERSSLITEVEISKGIDKGIHRDMRLVSKLDDFDQRWFRNNQDIEPKLIQFIKDNTEFAYEKDTTFSDWLEKVLDNNDLEDYKKTKNKFFKYSNNLDNLLSVIDDNPRSDEAYEAFEKIVDIVGKPLTPAMNLRNDYNVPRYRAIMNYITSHLDNYEEFL